MLNFDDEMEAPKASEEQLGRVRAEEKRVINGHSDVNQLVPFKYTWAWDKYLASCANHWMPQEVNMQRDIELWKSRDGLTDDERLIVKRNLGFFVTADSLAANNIVLGTYRQITAPECRQFLLRQAFEEAIHCYVDGTEILTPSGFKDFRELRPGDLVAQYHEDGRIDFVEPDEILHDDFDGELITFANESGTYLKTVTPGHRCVVTDPRRGDALKIVLAQDLSPRNHNFPVAGRLAGGREFTAMDALRVAYQADGSLVNAHTVETGAISGARCFRFQFKREDKIERLEALALEAGLECKNYGLIGGEGRNAAHHTLAIWVPSGVAATFDKKFAWVNLAEIGAAWIERFLEELGRWDGCARPSGSMCYTNTNAAAVEKVTMLAHLCGQRAGVYPVKGEGARQQAWQVHCYKKAHASGRSIEKSPRHHKGQVHCVGVPTGMIVVRSEGRIAISGNTHAYQYIVESLGMDEAEVFNAYREVSSIKAKDDFLIPFIDTLSNPTFKTGTPETDAQFLKSLIAFACVMEGLFFYVGFTQILALGRQNKMVGAAEQFQYILRDESMHCNFGIDLINTIKFENPAIWTPAFQAEILDMIRQGVDLEEAYAKDTMPRGVLGLNAGQFTQYLRFVANRRCSQIGLPEIYPGAENPFPWMSEMIDLKKERNFFETRVTEYQTGGALSWD